MTISIIFLLMLWYILSISSHVFFFVSELISSYLMILVFKTANRNNDNIEGFFLPKAFVAYTPTHISIYLYIYTSKLFLPFIFFFFMLHLFQSFGLDFSHSTILPFFLLRCSDKSKVKNGCQYHSALIGRYVCVFASFLFLFFSKSP